MDLLLLPDRIGTQPTNRFKDVHLIRAGRKDEAKEIVRIFGLQRLPLDCRKLSRKEGGNGNIRASMNCGCVSIPGGQVCQACKLWKMLRIDLQVAIHQGRAADLVENNEHDRDRMFDWCRRKLFLNLPQAAELIQKRTRKADQSQCGDRDPPAKPNAALIDLHRQYCSHSGNDQTRQPNRRLHHQKWKFHERTQQ